MDSDLERVGICNVSRWFYASLTSHRCPNDPRRPFSSWQNQNSFQLANSPSVLRRHGNASVSTSRARCLSFRARSGLDLPAQSRVSQESDFTDLVEPRTGLSVQLVERLFWPPRSALRSSDSLVIKNSGEEIKTMELIRNKTRKAHRNYSRTCGRARAFVHTDRKSNR
jgi:hypothetical protein